MERNAYLIHRKIHQYILPGVLMTVAMQLGNVVDGMIVGNILGPEAMAAIELSMPVLLLLQMPALMLAMGGAAEAAVLLGKRKLEEAYLQLPWRREPPYPSYLWCLRLFCQECWQIPLPEMRGWRRWWSLILQ